MTFPDDNPLLSVETAPGWVMLVLWSAFFITAILYFEEPDRSHLFPSPETKKFEPVKTLDLAAVSGTEYQPLVVTKAKSSTTSSSSDSRNKFNNKQNIPLYRNIPVMMTLWIYFVLKLVLECLLSSSATVTSYYFEWDSKHSGTFLAFLGLLMFPANMVIAKLSHHYEDRELIYVTLLVMFASVGGIFAYWPSHYSSFQYMFFGICIFLSTNCLEGPNMSLLTKTIPSSWAKG